MYISYWVYNLGLNDKIHTKNADMLETEDNILSNSNSATHDVPKIEGMYNTLITFIKTIVD